MIWKPVILMITDGVQDIPSPFSRKGLIEYHYVVVNEAERIGFLVAWCTETLKGIQISRVKVPAKLPFLTVEEFEQMKLPNIHWMDPAK